MIKILIADDHALFRQSLREIVESQKDMTVVAEAENGNEALKQTRAYRPDIILMDISMPELNGVDATRQITAIFDAIKIIGLSSHAEEDFVEKMMRAGASDYLSKICSRQDLINCIRAVWIAGSSSEKGRNPTGDA